MTIASVRKTQKTKPFSTLLSSLAVIAIFLLMLIMSGDISSYVKEGLNLSIGVIIPSVFPFLLITDIFITSIRIEKIPLIRRIFERIFKISGYAAAVFLCGILCGFPIGAKLSVDLYENGIISKCECERLMSFCNNPSPVYVIFVVGLGLRRNLAHGFYLYTVSIISSSITGWLIGISKAKTNIIHNIRWQNYNFAKSIKQSSDICINICAFVTTFAIACGLIKKFVTNPLISGIFISFFEISNATSYLSELCICAPIYSFIMTAFSLSFSGISVITQTACISASRNDLSIINHIKYKLLQGAISIITSLVFIPFI